ncbi:division plane positioning ATPase MipZ, partial [Candidatus Paracaedibacter symbiosus]|uniref:division plane positioning ATPase MipZ n=1 Tax=Candidatus Paracaedibacter symbiosus TaxID=244582 RepID=UPI000509ECCB
MNAQEKPYIIVLGNEKGGTGKSTLSMHLIVHLLRLGFKVGSIDIDARQGTLSRYIENRRKYIEMNGKELP